MMALKKAVRIFHPFYFLYTKIFLYKYRNIVRKYNFDEVFLGQRGNNYDARCKRVNRYKKIQDQIVLVVGCGEGNDIEGWLKFKPKKIIAFDLMDYQNVWRVKKEYFFKRYGIEVDFFQANADNLPLLQDQTIDIVCSDAVFQHLSDIDSVIFELTRVLKSGGVMYAAMGPLHYSFGGDILSGNNNVSEGFNHLLMKAEEYKNFISANLIKNDNRVMYFERNLFSYLRTEEYINKMNNLDYISLYKSCILSKRTIEFKKRFPSVYKNLLNDNNEDDLLIESLTLISEKS